jgi:hypothetical protein
MSTVPYTFADQTGNIPLSELDDNFANVKASVDFAITSGVANTATFATTATSAITANTVSNPFQPYITTLGLLTSVNVTGNITGARALNLGNGVSLTDTSGFAIGLGRGNHLFQGANAVAIGYNAGSNSQSLNSIAIGVTAGNVAQGANAIALGWGAAANSQGTYGVAIGAQAGRITQGIAAVSVGYLSGNSNQGNSAIAIGNGAGITNQGFDSVAIGTGTGSNAQGRYSVALGYQAGANTLGRYSVAIGYQAGFSNQSNNSIVLNATGLSLDGNTANAFFVSPIRNDNTAVGNLLFYKSTTKEVVYSNNISLGGTISATTIVTNQIASDDSSFINVLDGLNVQGSITSPGTISATGNITGLYFVAPSGGSRPTTWYGDGIITFPQLISNDTQINFGLTLYGNGLTVQSNLGVLEVTQLTNGNLVLPKNASIGGYVSATGNITGGNINNPGLEIVSPNYIPVTVNGQTISLSATQTTNFISANAAGYTITVNMPATPVDGQITRFTVSGNSVTTAVGTGTVDPTFAGLTAVGTGYKYIYRTSTVTWYRSI